MSKDKDQLMKEVFSKKRDFNFIDAKDYLNNTNHNTMSSNDLEALIQYQQESLKELTQGYSNQQLDALEKEINKDFNIENVSKDVDISSITFDELFPYLPSFNKAFYNSLRRPYLMSKEINGILGSILICNKSHIDIFDYFNKIQLGYQEIDCLQYNHSHISLFIQDLYQAIESKSKLIVFNHIDDIEMSYLDFLSDINHDGILSLDKRYKNTEEGISETSALMKNYISTIKLNKQYIIYLSQNSKKTVYKKLGNVFIDQMSDIIEITEEYKEDVSDLFNQFKLKTKDLLNIEITNDTYKTDLSYDELYQALVNLKLETNLSGRATLKNKLKLEMSEHNYTLSDYIKKIDDDSYSIKKELEQLVGLKQVKDYMYSLESYYNIQQLRMKKGLKADSVSKHLIFMGNPGTGKTTIARIFAQYLKSIHVLSNGQLVEVSRGDLVGQYVGHTAPLTTKVIQSAFGGVLFIDEAYSLYRGKDDSFGLEAIDTLVKMMEDHRDEFIVILAGYTKEMKTFLEANSGLKSRFSNMIEFDDYTAEECYEIAANIANSKDYKIDESLKDELITHFKHLQEVSGGNGRMVRNVIEAAILKQSQRLLKNDQADLTLLIKDDFEGMC